MDKVCVRKEYSKYVNKILIYRIGYVRDLSDNWYLVEQDILGTVLIMYYCDDCL